MDSEVDGGRGHRSKATGGTIGYMAISRNEDIQRRGNHASNHAVSVHRSLWVRNRGIASKEERGRTLTE